MVEKASVDLSRGMLLHPRNMMVETGDHTVLIGKVQTASANKSVSTDSRLDKAKVILHVSGNKFVTLNSEFVIPKI